jgi:shikimate 5-dehydrogenase
MFVNQGALQFERFTGAHAPVEIMRRVVMHHLES